MTNLKFLIVHVMFLTEAMFQTVPIELLSTATE